MTIKAKRLDIIYDIISENLSHFDTFRNKPFIYYYEAVTSSGEKIRYKKVGSKVLTNSISLVN